MPSIVFTVKEHVLPSQHIREYARATAFSNEDVLQLAVKQYIPLDNPNPQPGDVTIIGAHANGFPKELYEPLWEDIHARSKANGFRIRSIWVADSAHQGASGALNEHILGNDPSWWDHGRDLLCMVNHFRSDMILPIIGIGHSMGACQLANLAYMHPRLLATIIFIDPVIQRHASDDPHGGDIGSLPARASTFRRDLWPSRATAVSGFQKSRMYQAWDKRVLDRWLEYGIRDTPTALYPDAPEGSVTLATTIHQEVWTFLRPRYMPKGPYDLKFREMYPDLDPALIDNHMPFYRPEPPLTFLHLPHLRPSTFYVFGEKSEMSSPALQREKLSRTGVGIGGNGGEKEGRVKSVTLKGIGHLVAFLVPGQCADVVAEWSGQELQRWAREQEKYNEWVKKPLREKQTVDEEWKVKIGGPFPRPEKKPSKAKL